MTTGSTATASGNALSGAEIRKVIFASSLGTVFEWYDFYIYATLAPFFATLFFPKGNASAALLASFATYAAGFLVRPFGALVFGRIGDLVGRKYTFLITIMVMGLATAAVGVLPTYASVGMLSPIILVLLRLAQGVVWYTGQFYALFFLTGTLKVNWKTAYIILAVALALGTGLFIFFGWLSDKIGRKKIMLAGCLLGAVTYFPLYRAMTHFANPALEKFAASTQVSVTATDCKMHLFPN